MPPPMIDQSAAPAGPPAARPLRQRLRLPLLMLAAAAVVGIAGGTAAALLANRTASTSAVQAGPDETWTAGERLAPSFALHDQAGRPVSLAALRGRPVVVTFLDPVCRDFCPLEARQLNTVIAELPASERPAIVAVSVNRWADSRASLDRAARKWHFGPAWRWAVGSPRALAAVWHDYLIAVQDTPKKVAGATDHEIAHTEAAYLIDATGHQRALFMWPFQSADVLRAIRALARG